MIEPHRPRIARGAPPAAGKPLPKPAPAAPGAVRPLAQEPELELGEEQRLRPGCDAVATPGPSLVGLLLAPLLRLRWRRR